VGVGQAMVIATGLRQSSTVTCRDCTQSKTGKMEKIITKGIIFLAAVVISIIRRRAARIKKTPYGSRMNLRRAERRILKGSRRAIVVTKTTVVEHSRHGADLEFTASWYLAC